MLSFLEINGGMPMRGQIRVQGSKNAVLPMMAAAILNHGITVIDNVPFILDVCYMIHILEALGCKVDLYKETLMIDATTVDKTEIPFEWVGKMRSSIMLLGPLLARCKEAVTYQPGGCSIGKRPIDMHIDAMKQLGAHIEEEDGKIYASCIKLTGCNIDLPFPSVGATENVIMASICAEGTTVLTNAAREPEIVELCIMLCRMGANIQGVGSDKLTIQGVKKLHDIEVHNSGDRIVAATYLAAVTAAGGEIIVEDVETRYMLSTLEAFEAAGCKIDRYDRQVHLIRQRPLKAISLLQTAPYPGFPTDVQSQIMATLTQAIGVSVIEETIFEGRFNTVYELQKMGADITIDGSKAYIRGRTKLYGATVKAQDLRGGAALVVAALAADGATIVEDCHHIFRGYAGLAENLIGLGANVTAYNIDEASEVVL